jgi:acetyl esterase/lipase
MRLFAHERSCMRCLFRLIVLAAAISGTMRPSPFGRAEPSAQGIAPRLAMRVLRELPYFAGAGSDSRFHALDLYLPEGGSGVPLMFFVHGGGWRAGDKGDDLASFVDYCVGQGMAVASVNYRLAPPVRHPGHMQDLARAFAWVQRNGRQYGINPDAVFLAGHSAGAHLVSLLALDAKYLQQEGLDSSTIKGVVAISGVFDLVDFYEPGVVPSRVEQAFGTERETLRDASPSLKVRTAAPGSPPFLITYTDHELFGLDEQAKTFYSLFLAHRRPAQLSYIPGRDHFNVVALTGKRAAVNDLNMRPIVQVEDLLAPAIGSFVKAVQDGSFMRNFQAVWPEGGPAAVARREPAAMKATKDIQYFTGPDADAKANALDLYVPAGRANVPVLIEVHGGGWRAGDKGTPQTLIDILGRLGCAIVTVNYRLSPAVKHPTHVRDVARAFAWVYKNAAQHGLDRDRIVILGSSAGAHLVSLLALDTSYLKEQGVPPEAIRGVVATSGIYDLGKWPEPGKVPTRKEQAFGTDPKMLASASPIEHLRANAPPFLLTFTDHDLYLMPEQAHWFYDAALRIGLNVRLVQIPDRTHFDYMAGAGRPPIALVDDVLALELVNFVTQVIGPAPFASTVASSR